ncbi:MAG TPA: C4-dicarboxylate ABC transporter substrate-binding protein [Rhodospirillales bacterium]|nr:C4-dicarboxylate ABC transporter substrate-binding protein [Rhodospirillales bacterium]
MRYVAAAALAAGLVLGGAAQAQTTLRITLQLPIKSHLGQNLLQFEEEVEKASGGDIQVEIYPSAQLYKDKEVPQAVASGAIEMGVASLTRFAGTIPAVDVFYVPFLLDSADKVKKATSPGSPIRGPIDEAVLATGARILWWQPYGNTILLSKEKPLHGPQDIKGKKVRVFGKTLGKWVEVVGGKPVLTSGSEQFLAYQRGVVDIGMTGITTVKSRKLNEVMDAVTRVPIAAIEFVVVINEKVWQGLSDREREIISKAAANAEKAINERIVEIEADAAKYAVDSGMIVYDPTPEEMAAWREASQPMFELFAKEAGELGTRLVEEAKKL